MRKAFPHHDVIMKALGRTPGSATWSNTPASALWYQLRDGQLVNEAELKPNWRTSGHLADMQIRYQIIHKRHNSFGGAKI